jgi:hypothetical protein
LTNGNQAAIIKTYEDSSIGIVYNTSDDEISISLTGTQLEDMKIKGYLTLNDEKIALENSVLYMQPQSICVLK